MTALRSDLEATCLEVALLEVTSCPECETEQPIWYCRDPNCLHYEFHNSSEPELTERGKLLGIGITMLLVLLLSLISHRTGLEQSRLQLTLNSSELFLQFQTLKCH